MFYFLLNFLIAAKCFGTMAVCRELHKMKVGNLACQVAFQILSEFF